MTMATFVLIHGGGDVGWYWHLVERELRQRGHDALVPDLPCDDDSAGLAEYADVVVEAIGGRRGLGPGRAVVRRVHCAAGSRPGSRRLAQPPEGTGQPARQLFSTGGLIAAGGIQTSTSGILWAL
jgi:hypothetical protein